MILSEEELAKINASYAAAKDSSWWQSDDAMRLHAHHAAVEERRLAQICHLPKGQAFILRKGSYSDIENIGLFRLLKDTDLQALAREHCNEVSFCAFLVANGYAEEIDFVELHVCIFPWKEDAAAKAKARRPKPEART